MAVSVIMPRQGQSVESCIITKWAKKVGDSVSEGDILFSYETDKATFDEISKVSGILLEILSEEGDDVPCLENVAVIGSAGEDISGLQTSTTNTDSELKISPRAKAIAQNQMLEIEKAIPTGPNGRIIERDILELSKNAQFKAPAILDSKALLAGAYEDIPLSNIRKSIAKAMHASISGMAQLTHSFSFDATQIIAYRKLLKESSGGQALENITYNDMILFAVSRVILNHKDINTHFLDGKMRYFKDVNLGMAVDTPRGLLVPTIFGANKLTLNEIAAEAKSLATQAQSGTISPDYLQGGTFTISNLGSFDVEHFTPVINPPQTGIIGVNNIQIKFRMVGDQPVPYQAMGLSLTYDHRAIDGAPASRFMQEVCRTLENFAALLAK